MWTRRGIGSGLLALLAVGALAGCSPAVEAAAQVTAAPIADPVADPVVALRAAMLTPDEVGAGFVAAKYLPSGPDDAFTCGQPGLAARYESVQAGAALSRGADLLVIESVHVFGDVTTAQQAYADVGEGFGCGTGTTVDGTTAQIGPAQNVTAQVGGDQAQAWTIDAEGTRLVVISVQAQQAVVAFSLVVTSDADPATVPDAATVARTGMTKLLEAS